MPCKMRLIGKTSDTQVFDSNACVAPAKLKCPPDRSDDCCSSNCRSFDYPASDGDAHHYTGVAIACDKRNIWQISPCVYAHFTYYLLLASITNLYSTPDRYESSQRTTHLRACSSNSNTRKSGDSPERVRLVRCILVLSGPHIFWSFAHYALQALPNSLARELLRPMLPPPALFNLPDSAVFVPGIQPKPGYAKQRTWLARGETVAHTQLLGHTETRKVQQTSATHSAVVTYHHSCNAEAPLQNIATTLDARRRKNGQGGQSTPCAFSIKLEDTGLKGGTPHWPFKP